MRLSRVLLAGGAVAVVAVTTSAFTASNTVPDSVAGYGQGLVTGAEVQTIHYVRNAGNGTILDAVEFTLETEVTTATSTMTLKTGVQPDGTGGSVVGTPYSCAVKPGFEWDGDSLVLICDTTGTVRNFEDFNSVGLTVVQ
jgi:hypothetical protein